MYQETHETLTDFAMLSTFLGDEEILRLGKDAGFREHVVKQKRTLASLLKNSFELTNDSSPLPKSQANSSTSVEKGIEKGSRAGVYKPGQATAFTPTPVPTATVPSAPQESKNSPSLLKEITGLFSEKTGYPEDMLDPNLDLEADLGIDTVKQMEILGLIRRKYGLVWKENFTLKQTPTLTAIVKMIQEVQPTSTAKNTD